MSLQQSDGDSLIQAGGNVTVRRPENETVSVAFQRPPPTRYLPNPFRDPCYTTRNVTLSTLQN